MKPTLQGALEREITARWYACSPGWLWALFPLEVLFRGVAHCRRALYAAGWLRSETLPVPVVVVGNIVAGGAGKTPITAALTRLLKAQGYRPGVMSRGYGRSSERATLVTISSQPEDVGDEPLLLLHETGVPVAVARRRVEAAQILIAAGCDVLLADDGLQHYALARDIEIAVIPGARREGNGHLLPLGPLREPRSRLQRCDFRLVANGKAEAGEIAVYGKTGALRNLHDGSLRPLAELRGVEVLAVAAIAHPEPFYRALEEAGLQVETRRFKDHHRLTAADLQDTRARPLVMTTKDAVKCRLPAGREAYALEYTVHLPTHFAELFVAQVAAVAARKQGLKGPDAG